MRFRKAQLFSTGIGRFMPDAPRKLYAICVRCRTDYCFHAATLDPVRAFRYRDQTSTSRRMIMKVSKTLISGAAAISLMGAIGLTYAQSSSSGTGTSGTTDSTSRDATGATGTTSTMNPNSQALPPGSAGTPGTASTPGTTGNAATGADRDTASTSTPDSTAGSMERDSPTGTTNRDSMATQGSTEPGAMSGQRVARADRN